MPPFQLPIAGLLAFSAVASLIVFFCTRSTEGKIQLSTNEPAFHDPFDVVTPEDIVDGDPIDEEKFWRKVR